MKNKIARTLYRLRVCNNYSGKDMAEKLGISQAQYSKIERGKKDLTLQSLERIAAVFDLSLRSFLEMAFDEGTIYPRNNTDQLQILEQIFHPRFIETFRLYLEYTSRQNQPENVPGQ